jgi:hypothetical protein
MEIFTYDDLGMTLESVASAICSSYKILSVLRCIGLIMEGVPLVTHAAQAE